MFANQRCAAPKGIRLRAFDVHLDEGRCEISQTMIERDAVHFDITLADRRTTLCPARRRNEPFPSRAHRRALQIDAAPNDRSGSAATLAESCCEVSRVGFEGKDPRERLL